MVIRKLKKFFADIQPAISEPLTEEDISTRIQLATCVLLLDIAHSDDHFSKEEEEHIVEILVQDFNLSDEYAAELMELAHRERKESVDLWQFTNVIDNNYSREEKEKVVETFWKVVYADKHLDAFEDHLIHRLSKLLNLSHKQLIDAKKKVMGWIGKQKKTLPFSDRELIKEFRTGQFAIRELITSGKLAKHHVLKEENGMYVAQFEHTFIVTADGIEQFT